MYQEDLIEEVIILGPTLVTLLTRLERHMDFINSENLSGNMVSISNK